MLHGPSQNICQGPETKQAKSSLKKEFEDDDDALIEGVTRREGNIGCSASMRSDVKPLIKPDCELDALDPTFSGLSTSLETKVEMTSIKKESSKRRSPTPDDVVLVLDDSSSHSGGTSWVRWYAGLVFGDGKALRNDSVLVGCARTDVRYDASRVKNKHKKYVFFFLPCVLSISKANFLFEVFLARRSHVLQQVVKRLLSDPCRPCLLPPSLGFLRDIEAEPIAPECPTDFRHSGLLLSFHRD